MTINRLEDENMVEDTSIESRQVTYLEIEAWILSLAQKLQDAGGISVESLAPTSLQDVTEIIAASDMRIRTELNRILSDQQLIQAMIKGITDRNDTPNALIAVNTLKYLQKTGWNGDAESLRASKKREPWWMKFVPPALRN
jgi:hypothetical protein